LTLITLNGVPVFLYPMEIIQGALMKFVVDTTRKPSAARRKTLGLAGAALGALLGLGASAQAATFTVTSNADSGGGTLRQAIIDANANAGADTIDFNLTNFTIAPLTAFPSIDEALTISGPTASGNPTVVLDGTGAGLATDGLAIRAANCAISNLTIQNYGSNGISIAGASVTGVTVTNCRIGTNSAGTVAAPNNNGIAIFNGANNNTIGGTTTPTLNLISGNTTNGILIFGAGTDNNTVRGNRIGTNLAGTGAIGNAAGVIIFGGAKNNHIGNAIGNHISGNTGSGIQIFNAGTTGNTVESNIIGANDGGTAALANGSHGVQINDEASNNTIGGATTVNQISGNGGNGVLITAAGTNSNTVIGNWIGTNAAINAAVANVGAGVQIQSGAEDNQIGAIGAGRNIISGNTAGGIKILGAGTTSNDVLNNYVGTNDAGTSAIANGSTGIEILTGATANVIGGTIAGLGNLISGNTGAGIQISGTGTSSNQVFGNKIGTNAAGTAALANGTLVTVREGLYLTSGAQNNVIGATGANGGNLISGNTGNGVSISSATTTGNRLINNKIGTDAAGTAAIANAGHGIEVRSGALNTTIGLLLATAGAQGPLAESNTIAFNTRDGVRVASPSVNTLIRGNQIFSNGELGINLSGGTENGSNVTSNDGAGDADTGANNLQNFPVLTNVQQAGSNLSATITLTSANSTAFTFDIYGNTTADSSGAGEGQSYIGSATSTSNGSGVATVFFGSTITGSPAFITATATDAQGNTSEFSTAVAITAAPAYSATGRLTNSVGGAGLANVSVSVSGAAIATTTTNGNGDFTFTNLPAGNYVVTPATSSGYSFTPTSRNFTVTNANITGQNFTGTATGVRLHGRVATSAGIAIPNVSVSRTGSATPVLTNGAGYYVFNGVTPGTYTVTPSLTGYTFTPASKSITVAGSDVVNQNFIGASGPPPAPTYQLHGRVANTSGVGLAGVSVSRTGSATPILTNGAGYYSFTGVPAGTYTVTPSLNGFTFSPPTRSVTITNANSVNNNFIGASGPPPAPTYQLHGRIATSAGVGIAGVSVARTGSATPVVTNGAGYYSFTGVVNGTYTVTPTLSGYTFTPATRSVTVADANSVNNNFVGAQGPPPAPTYRLHGRVATSNGVGLAGVSVTRTGSATPVVTNGAGYYQFNGVPNGTYTVTPSLSGRTFTPTSRTITINNAESVNNNFIASGQ